MQLSRSIFVLEDRGHKISQLCYNSTFPTLFSFCDPSQKLYCSINAPEYGCTRDLNQACTEFHFCNTPTVVLIVLSIILGVHLLLLTTGCLWCCCCCFCGRCCQRSFPIFARMQYYKDLISTTRPIGGLKPGLPWNMYSGLEHVLKDTSTEHRRGNSVTPSSELSFLTGSNLSTASGASYYATPTAPPPPTYRPSMMHSGNRAPHK